MTRTLDAETLDLHRRLVATPSLSHEEGPIADLVEELLRERGARVDRIGDNVLARAGSGPRLLLNSHLDTVPPTERWSRDPFAAEREGERIFGLGSNDAKASVAAMISAFVEVLDQRGPCELVLMLVPEEETGGEGTERAWPALQEEGFRPQGAVVGEPTGLDLAVAQKGMLVVELARAGDVCHSAHATALGARNAVHLLARDLVALEDLDLGEADAVLGPTTLQPTVLRAGERGNVLPAEARVRLDLRTVPGLPHEELVARIRARVGGEVRVRSDRLRPRSCPPGARVLEAARRARPGAREYGSCTMSDLVWFEGVPAIKCGPGRSERSHTPDEFVLASEILAGARFYGDLVRSFAELAG